MRWYESWIETGHQTKHLWIILISTKPWPWPMAHGPSALGSNFFGMSGVANGGSAFSRVSTFCLACCRSASSPASVATQRMKKSGGLSSRGHCKPARWNRWSKIWSKILEGSINGSPPRAGWFMKNPVKTDDLGGIVQYSHPRWGKLCIWKTWITWHKFCSSDIRMVGKDRRRF